MCVGKEFGCKYVILNEAGVKRIGKGRIQKTLFINPRFFGKASEGRSGCLEGQLGFTLINNTKW